MGGNNGNQDIHIELNRIFGNGSNSCNGITIARGNPGTLIVNNLVYGNGRNGIAFEDADGGPHYIISNTIYGNQWNGIDVARNHTVTIANNIINKNGTASGSTGGRFGVRRESSNNPQPAGIKLRNNLVCGNMLGEINGPMLDTTDSGNFTPQGSEGVGVGGARWVRFVGQSLRKVSTVLTICPTHRTMILVCVRIRLPSMSGWTRAHLDSTLPQSDL